MGESVSGIRGGLSGLGALALAAGLLAGTAVRVEAQASVDPVIVILGSSTAAGTGATDKDSAWAGRYAKACQARPKPWNVVNLGVGGYTTFHIRPTGAKAVAGRPAPDTAKNITKALSLNPKGILINMPSNDANSGYSAAEQKANYDTLAALCQRAGIGLWVCSAQPRTTLINDPAKKAAHLEVKDWIFTRFGTRAVDFWNGLARSDASIDPIYNAGDDIHLNDRGHRLLFERVMGEDVPGELEKIVALMAPVPRAAPRAFAGVAFDVSGRVLRTGRPGLGYTEVGRFTGGRDPGIPASPGRP